MGIGKGVPWWVQEIDLAEALGMTPWELEEAPQFWIQRILEYHHYVGKRKVKDGK